MTNWDTNTADKCKLPEMIPNICDGCRCYLYCHRQLTINDLWRRAVVKEICKNCEHSHPTYKGISCDIKKKKVKTTDTCERWGAKK